jgi:hypothetical protein
MTDRLDFETRLEERLRARAALASRPFDAAEIAREAVAVNGRRWRLGRLEWPSTRPALGWLIMALLLAIALLGAVAGVGGLLREPDPVPVERMTVIRQLVLAINVRDTDAFIDAFIPEATFQPGGDFRDTSSLFGNSLPLADASLVEAWMAINDAWDFEAEIIACNQDPEAAIRYGYGEGQGDPMVVTCEVATRWHSLSMEITERWNYEFHGSGLGHWGFDLLDLNPRERALPLGYDGLEAWEAWLQKNDPASAARYLRTRGSSCTDSARDAINGCWEGQEALAPGDPERAAQLARLLSITDNAWSINGHVFNPASLIPYDTADAAEIEASIQEYLDGSISDYTETRP